MLPLIGGLLSGGASLLGSIFSSNTSASNTQAQIQAQEAMQGQTEQFNAGEAQKTRDYQTQMSNTAYQRASQDMSKAGLNPMMMFGSGSAASSPVGATASVGTPTVPMPQTRSPLGDLGKNVSDALNTSVTVKTMDKMSEEVANLVASRGLTEAATKVEGEKAKTQEALTHKTSYEATQESLKIMAERLRAANSAAVLADPNQADIARGKNMQSTLGGIAGGVAGTISNSANTIKKYVSGHNFSDRFNAVYGNSE